MFKYELGKEAKDKITSFEGILVVRAEHLFGCNTYGIAPQRLDSGKKLDTSWFDEGRIAIIGDGINKEEVQTEKKGSEFGREHPNI